jgi:glutathione synthase/RimK-type ligase-like ATP-grasp enzyme
MQMTTANMLQYVANVLRMYSTAQGYKRAANRLQMKLGNVVLKSVNGTIGVYVIE